jgi:hypothetical protein
MIKSSLKTKAIIFNFKVAIKICTYHFMNYFTNINLQIAILLQGGRIFLL